VKPGILNSIFFLVAAGAFLSFDMPTGWSSGGTDLTQYEMGLDKDAGRNGTPAATIKSIPENPKSFGTMLQYFAPGKYAGKRIRMTGYMKSKEVSGWAGFWLRIDQANSKEALAFDNMHDRPVKGTSGWTLYAIVLEVPENASNMAFGALLNGRGQIWFDDMGFEVVDKTVPVTGTYKEKMKSPAPANLNFEN
jgi:hypothetical protein